MASQFDKNFRKFKQKKFYVIFRVIFKSFGRNYGRIESIAEKQ